MLTSDCLLLVIASIRRLGHSDRSQDGVPRNCQTSNEAHANTDTGPGSGGVYTRRRTGKIKSAHHFHRYTNSSIIRAFCPGMEVPSTDSANLIKPLVTAPATKFRKLSNTSTVMFQDTHPDLDPKSQHYLHHPQHQQHPDPLHQYHNLSKNKAEG